MRRYKTRASYAVHARTRSVDRRSRIGKTAEPQLTADRRCSSSSRAATTRRRRQFVNRKSISPRSTASVRCRLLGPRPPNSCLLNEPAVGARGRHVQALRGGPHVDGRAMEGRQCARRPHSSSCGPGCKRSAPPGVRKQPNDTDTGKHAVRRGDTHHQALNGPRETGASPPPTFRRSSRRCPRCPRTQTGSGPPARGSARRGVVLSSMAPAVSPTPTRATHTPSTTSPEEVLWRRRQPTPLPSLVGRLAVASRSASADGRSRASISITTSATIRSTPPAGRAAGLAPTVFSAHFRDNGSIARVGLNYRFY